MSIITHTFILFIAILLGLSGQWGLGALQAKSAQTSPPLLFRLCQIALSLYWSALGVLLLFGGLSHFSRSEVLPGIATIALGQGLAMAGIGQTFEIRWLRLMGVVIMTFGAFALGGYALFLDLPLLGLIFIAFGLGVLFSSLSRGFGTLLVGGILIASGVLFLTNIVPIIESGSALQFISIGLIAIGLVAAIVGISVLVTPVATPEEQSPQAEAAA